MLLTWASASHLLFLPNLLTTKEATETLVSLLKVPKSILCSVSSCIRGLSTVQLFYVTAWVKTQGYLGYQASQPQAWCSVKCECGQRLTGAAFGCDLSSWRQTLWYEADEQQFADQCGRGISTLGARGRLTQPASKTTSAWSCPSQLNLQVRWKSGWPPFQSPPTYFNVLPAWRSLFQGKRGNTN